MICASCLLKRFHVQLALAQNIGRFRNIDKRFRLRQRARRTNADEEVRVLRASASAIDARLGRPETHGWMKRERLHAILQQQATFENTRSSSRTNSSRFKLVLVKRIRSSGRASLGVVALVRRRDDEQSFAASAPARIH